jgi:hypothetical protein
MCLLQVTIKHGAASLCIINDALQSGVQLNIHVQTKANCFKTNWAVKYERQTIVPRCLSSEKKRVAFQTGIFTKPLSLGLGFGCRVFFWLNAIF